MARPLDFDSENLACILNPTDGQEKTTHIVREGFYAFPFRWFADVAIAAGPQYDNGPAFRNSVEFIDACFENDPVWQRPCALVRASVGRPGSFAMQDSIVSIKKAKSAPSALETLRDASRTSNRSHHRSPVLQTGVVVNRCPSAQELELLLSDELSHVDRDTIVAHVEGCTRCQEQLERIVAEPVSGALLASGDYPEPEAPTEFLNRLRQMPPPRCTDSVDQDSGRIAAAMPLQSGTPETDFGRRLEGRRLGQYEILERLGQGNMGVVYKAVHVELGKVVALKVLPAGVMQEISIARFKKEVRAIGRLDHPNIVGTHDAGQIQGIHFLVMSLVDGVDLARLVEQRGRLSISDACEVARQAAVGLHHAYGRSLVHRDVKPSNLMLTRDGQVKVLDLGLARSLGEEPVVERLTATGWILGTADYLAPEQWEDPHEVGTQADIYSLGCTLYHLIAGHPPFVGQQHSSVPKKMRAHLEVPAPPLVAIRPDVPASLDAVVLRMLAKNPADRYATPGDVAEALRPFAAQSNLAALVESAELPAANLPRPAAAESATGVVRTTSKVNEKLTGHISQPGRPRSLRRYGFSLAVLGLCVMLGIFVTAWPVFQGSPFQHGPLKILGMGIRQYRGELAEPLGDITATTHVIRADDTIRVSAKLNKPAYCYLIAFNPDGTEQLCYPEDPDLAAVNYPEHKDLSQAMITRPARTQVVQFPQDLFFEPGVAGLQAFVLIASSQPLPAYAQWRSQVGPIPWGPNAYRQTWRWRFDGQSFDPLPIERGKRVELGVPSEFKELCNFIQARPQAEAVQALAFPVSGQ